MNTIFGQFNRETKELQLNNDRYSYYEENEIICSVYGDVWIENVCNDYATIIKAYQDYGDDIVNCIEGLYYLVIYDKSANILRIYQDYFTSAETLYYTILDEYLYFTNDMKQMISLPNMERSFNMRASVDFVRYGFVSGEETLLQNIYKLAPFHMLFCEKEHIVQKRLDYRFDILGEEESAKKWVKDLNRAIRMNTPEKNPVTLPLSGGFDSNYIFNYYNRKEKNTRLFTVGGVDGIDETKMVKKIVNAYGSKRNELHLLYTTNDTLKYLPDIIWRLGGVVYQRGIFLQYELAKELQRAGITTLVCGECADQIMHENFLQSGLLNGNPNYKGPENPYDFAASIIIKKSAVMLNSFGVKGYYPYMNQRFMQTAMGLAKKNGITKAFHCKMCNQILPDEVRRCLYKNGGATYMHALFATEEEKTLFVNVVENSPFYQELQIMKGVKKTKAEKIRHAVEKAKEYSKGFARRVKGTLGVQSIRTLTPKYIKMESRLRRDMGYFYLMIFRELFCSDRTYMYLQEGIDSFNVYDYLEELSKKYL
ncbi:MAG: hypothetical protein IJP29_04620 [Lachnospiraceae bacterium]|nr:hypothetical protein [Lachnospiraceae bacterium]